MFQDHRDPLIQRPLKYISGNQLEVNASASLFTPAVTVPDDFDLLIMMLSVYHLAGAAQNILRAGVNFVLPTPGASMSVEWYGAGYNFAVPQVNGVATFPHGDLLLPARATFRGFAVFTAGAVANEVYMSYLGALIPKLKI